MTLRSPKIEHHPPLDALEAILSCTCSHTKVESFPPKGLSRLTLSICTLHLQTNLCASLLRLSKFSSFHDLASTLSSFFDAPDFLH